MKTVYFISARGELSTASNTDAYNYHCKVWGNGCVISYSKWQAMAEQKRAAKAALMRLGLRG